MKCYIHNEADAVGTCTSCGKAVCSACEMTVNGKTVCKDCVQRMAGQTVTINRKEPILSLILSFLLPGLGQIYNGQVRKGIIMIIGYILLSWTCLIPILMWLYGMYDGYTTAVKINSGQTIADW